MASMQRRGYVTASVKTWSGFGRQHAFTTCPRAFRLQDQQRFQRLPQPSSLDCCGSRVCGRTGSFICCGSGNVIKSITRRPSELTLRWLAGVKECFRITTGRSFGGWRNQIRERAEECTPQRRLYCVETFDNLPALFQGGFLWVSDADKEKGAIRISQ